MWGTLQKSSPGWIPYTLRRARPQALDVCSRLVIAVSNMALELDNIITYLYTPSENIITDDEGSCLILGNLHSLFLFSFR